MSEKLYKLIDLCISNFNYGGRLPTKELEHEYFDLKKEIKSALKLQNFIQNGNLDAIINKCQDTDGYVSTTHLRKYLLEESKRQNQPNGKEKI